MQMNLLRRPLKNIATFDIGMISWCSVWMFLFVTWAAPSGLLILADADIDPFRFLFSFDFLEVTKGELESLTLAQVAVRNNLYPVLNIGKVALWLLLSISVLGFLFQQPKGENDNE